MTAVQMPFEIQSAKSSIRTANRKQVVTNHNNRAEKTVRYHRGRPLGADQTQNYDKWDDDIRKHGEPLRTMTDFHQYFNYDTLQNTYPWATVFRAGIVIIHHPGDMRNAEMLMVHQKPTTYVDADIEKKLGTRIGFPKGCRESGDLSAWHTAERETFEETKINLSNPYYGAKLSVTSCVIPRSEVQEVFIYFICVLERKPPVSICKNELEDYEWVKLNTGLRGIKNTTGPTARLLCELENVNFESANLIPLANAPSIRNTQ